MNWLKSGRAVRGDGSVLVVPKKIPKLTYGAVPSSYLSSECKQKLEEPEERRKEAEARDEDAFSKWLANDVISDFKQYKSRIENMKIGGFTVIVNDIERCIF